MYDTDPKFKDLSFDQVMKNIRGNKEFSSIENKITEIERKLFNLGVPKENLGKVFSNFSYHLSGEQEITSTEILKLFETISDTLAEMSRTKDRQGSLFFGKLSGSFTTQRDYRTIDGHNLTQRTILTTKAEIPHKPVSFDRLLFISPLITGDRKPGGFTTSKNGFTTEFTPTLMPNLWVAYEQATGSEYVIYGEKSQIEQSWEPKVKKEDHQVGFDKFIGS